MDASEEREEALTERAFIKYLADVKKKDYKYLRETLGLLAYMEGSENSGPTTLEHQRELLNLISQKIEQISYKKGSIKDRWRDLPWHNLEHLHHLLQKLDEPENPDYELLQGLCHTAIPLIVKQDLPELRERFQKIWIEYEGSHNDEQIPMSVNRSVLTSPPPVGLVYTVRLTSFFMDVEQLSTIVKFTDVMLSAPYTGSPQQKFALLRVLSVVGESTKYLSSSCKDPSIQIPWKNIEKVRDLLSHVSRIPMREAVDKLLQDRDDKKDSVPQFQPSLPNPKSLQRKEKKQDKRKARQRQKALALLQKTALIATLVWAIPLLIILFHWEIEVKIMPSRILMIWTALVLFVSSVWYYIRWRADIRPPPKCDSSAIEKIKRKPSDLPPQLLTKIATHDLPSLNSKLKHILRDRESVKEHISLRLFLKIAVVLLVAAGLYLANLDLYNWVHLTGIVVLTALVHKLNACLIAFISRRPHLQHPQLFGVRKRRAAEVWKHLPTADTMPDASHQKKKMKQKLRKMQTTGATNKSRAEDFDAMIAVVKDEKLKERLRKIVNGEAKLERADTDQLFSAITQKEEKQKWAAILFGQHNSVRKISSKGATKEGNKSKSERLKDILKAKENSTLNKERGLDHIRMMRVFLQAPTNVREDPKKHCLTYALKAIESIETLTQQLNEQEQEQDPILLLALSYNIGLYALYGAQVKWYFPHLIGNEHIDMRDKVMHGINHSYTRHLTEGSLMLKSHVSYLTAIKPSLKNALKDK